LSAGAEKRSISFEAPEDNTYSFLFCHQFISSLNGHTFLFSSKLMHSTLSERKTASPKALESIFLNQPISHYPLFLDFVEHATLALCTAISLVTSQAIAQIKPLNSRATAVHASTGRLPLRTRYQYLLQSLFCAFHAIACTDSLVFSARR
jgi:hypothetical protein